MMASMKVECENESRPSTNEYGYGLLIDLNDDQVEALGIKDPIEAGEVVSIKASAFVRRSEQSVDDEDGETDIRLSLQITDMELIHDDGRSGAQKMYSKSDMEP